MSETSETTIDVESLRPTVLKFCAYMKKVSVFLAEIKEVFLAVISTPVELRQIMPELEQMYVDAYFEPEEKVIFGKNLNLKHRHLSTLNKAEKGIRKLYLVDNVHLSRKLEHFREKLTTTLFGNDARAQEVNTSEAAQVNVIPNDHSTPHSQQTKRHKQKSYKPVTEAIAKTTETSNRRSSIRNAGLAVEQPTAQVPKRKVDKLDNSTIHAKQNTSKNVNRRQIATSKASDLNTPPDVLVPAKRKSFPTLPQQCTPSTNLEPLPQTKQESKRRKKKYTKKIANSIWNLRSVKAKDLNRFYAYVNDRLSSFEGHSVLKCFEDRGMGFVAFSMVTDIRQPTGEEMDIINMFTRIQNQYTHVLISETQRRLINQPSGGKYSIVYTAKDDKRRAYSIGYGADERDLKIVVNYYIQHFIAAGLVHPDTRAGNAKGRPGIELLYKGSGLKGQVHHFDFPTTSDEARDFKSYNHSIRNKLPFDTSIDGGTSLFINHTANEDTLSRPDGSFIVIPAYSFCLLRGNVAHAGTGNTTDSPIFKFFCYLDPVDYHRATNKFRDSVFIYDAYKVIVRSRLDPFEVLYTPQTVPYHCLYCGVLGHYTNPLCLDCFELHWRIDVSCDEILDFCCTYRGIEDLDEGYVFPDRIKKGIMTRGEFDENYKALRQSGVGRLFLSETHVLSLLETQSILSCMKTHDVLYNVELVIDQSGKFATLRTTTPLHPDEEMILRAHDAHSDLSFVLDKDEYAIRAICGGDEEMDFAMKVLDSLIGVDDESTEHDEQVGESESERDEMNENSDEEDNEESEIEEM